MLSSFDLLTSILEVFYANCQLSLRKLLFVKKAVLISYVSLNLDISIFIEENTTEILQHKLD